MKMYALFHIYVKTHDCTFFTDHTHEYAPFHSYAEVTKHTCTLSHWHVCT